MKDGKLKELTGKEVEEMRDKKPLPIGIDDFKTIIEEDYYYVDKTKMIESLLDDSAGVTLFTRPRRFGKTLNMSMLNYFFNLKKKEENRKLFENLYISKSKYMDQQGEYPVIYLSFKDIKALNWEKCYYLTRRLITYLYNEFEFLREKLNKKDLSDFDKVWLDEEGADWENSLKNLLRYLYEYHNKKVVVLIDEYDTPIVSGYNNGYKKEVLALYRSLYSTVLKSNAHLQFSVMTGILRIAKEGIFSGLNNLKVNSIFSEKYSEYYGMTEEEVLEGLKYYNLEYEINDVKDWYDGYQFGNIEVYNPWSIINFLDNGKLKPYWQGTAGNETINELLDRGNKEIFDDLEKLFRKEIVYKKIRDFTEFTDDINEIWELFLYSGYLTTSGEQKDKEHPIRIPNREIMEFFEDRFIDRFTGNYQKFSDTIRYLRAGNIEKFGEILQNEVISSLSYFDTDKDEKYYKVFLIGIFVALMNDYVRLSERESGHGRADLILEPKKKENPGYIFEFKVSKSEEELESYAEEGFGQIKEKKYDTELINHGVTEIIYIGLAFYKKKLKMKYEKNIIII
ncbi:hypothetical protein HMPREF1984_01933 [Leptotrichia sp. oral taxon 215 str. W9775]|uniref:AAA family ATPase n=1 Tax=Leptotrichia sp. oral taxon 215 TaxID=712359 RepID=UPI0003ADE886|nr:AAA family ATPase [Leptotrichia sp. oral taxon 215]ERK65992.1 hypothetical protein HMPREF1984_01933 [Leptotrichia sp. oral taxon 215 str. W9775]